MAERALAHVEKIEWIRPIEGADNIELIGVLGWVCIAKIGEFNVGDTAVYIEIDSKCPETDVQGIRVMVICHHIIQKMVSYAPMILIQNR